MRTARRRPHLLVLTGYGARENCQPDFTVADAAEAVSLILGRAGD